MKTSRFLFGTAILAMTAFSSACFDEKVVAPEDPLPPVLAIDRPTVQLFRFARGRMVKADTVRITNNGEGPLGVVEKVGGVDYITTARVGWLKATVENVGKDEALLILEPTYAEDEQDAADVAEVVLKAQGSTELKRVHVIARTLRGATFEFSVSPLAFSAVPGDPAMTQRLTVRNGGNGTLQIHPPTLRFKGAGKGWLSLVQSSGSETAPEFEITADPGTLNGGLFEAFIVFESNPNEETRAKSDSVTVQLNIGQPTLRVSTANLLFSVIRGGEDPPPQTVLLTNAGEGPFAALGSLGLGEVSYETGTGGWLDVALNGPSIAVAARTGSLGTGDYRATFPVVSENGGSKDIRVTLSVEAPILTPSSRTVSFGLVEGDSIPPAPQKIGISNSGSGTLASLGTLSLGNLIPAVAWLDTELVADTVILTPTDGAANLVAGNYTTRLPLLSTFGGSDTLSITLSVSRGLDPPVLALSANRVEFSGISGDPSPPPQAVQISNAGGGTLGTLSLGTVSYDGEVGWLTASLAGTTVTLTATTGSLPDDTHTATVPVSSANGGDGLIEVSFAVGSPILTASATSASFSATEGGGNPASQTITFTNTGPGSFASLGAITVGSVTYAGTGGWLSTSYADATLTLSATTGALSSGTYKATLPVNSAEGGSVTIAVTFTVVRITDAADLVASPATVRMDAVRGGSDPPSETVVLSNGGGGTLGALGVSGITYLGGTSGWLSASLAGNIVTMDATTGSLASGAHEATVGLTSANGGNETVQVTFVVAAPNLTLSSTSASFSGQVGGTASPTGLTVNLSNTGAGDFSSLGTVSVGTISYGGTGGWLSASLAGGGAQVDLAATIGGLGAGTYTASVPVNSTAGGSETISVTLTVSPLAPAPVLSLSASSAAFHAEEGGGDPDPQDIVISNSGGGGGTAALGALSLGTITYGTAPGWLTASRAGITVTLSAATDTLTVAGSPYTATVPVQSEEGGTRNIAVTFTIYAAAAPADLVVSPASIRMDAVAGGSNPPDQEVVLSNAGSGPLGPLDVVGITYGNGDGWLSEGIVSSTLTLSADITGLAADTYDATVEVESGNGGNETIDVTLVVAEPVLSLSSTSASFSGPVGGAAAPASVSVTLSNTGAGDFSSLGTITLGTTVYGAGATGWLTAELSGGNTQVDLSATLGDLGAGTYTATVPVNSPNGGTASVNVVFSVSQTASAPSLSLSASAVGFTALLGGSSPAPKTVTLSNSGGGTVGDLGDLGLGTITYGGEGTGWLSTSSLVGTTITLRPVTAPLSDGPHTATVPVTSEFGGNRTLSVTVDVASPTLTASTLGLSFTGQVDGVAPASQSVTFSNTGAGTYGDLGAVTVGAITYGGGGSGWVVEPGNGDAVVGGTLEFVVDQAGLAAGAYSATVPVSSQYGGPETITVSLTVVRETDPPLMVLSATTQRFDALVGGTDPPPQTITVSNAGGGTLGTVQVGSLLYGTGASGWLSPSINGNTITSEARTGSLAQGTYNATFQVTSDGGSQSVSVRFVVGTSRLTLSPRTLSFGDSVGGSGPPPRMVAIANTGGGSYQSLGTISLEPTIYGDGATGWLDATLAAPDSVRVQAVTGSLLPRGTPYGARIPVVSTLGGSDTILVSFTVAPGTSPPRLALSLDSLTFSGILGTEAPAAQSVSGFNSGGGELGSLTIGGIDYGAGAQDWLSGSVLGSTVTLHPLTDGLAGGTHRATVTVASENGGERPLAVTLVLAPPVLSLSSQAVTFSDTVGSPDTLRSQVFVGNTGAGNRASLGSIHLGSITYPEGEPGWLRTVPEPGELVEGFVVGLSGSAAGLPEGRWVALVPVTSEWGGSDTVAVTFAARVPDRSFDLPTIELVKDTLVNGNLVRVPLPGDSVVLGPVTGDTAVRVGVRNGSETRVTLSGLRVGIPTYPLGQASGWITGAFLNRTTATFEEPAELVVVVGPAGLPTGRYEGRLVVSSESAGLEEVAPRVLRVILVVR